MSTIKNFTLTHKRLLGGIGLAFLVLATGYFAYDKFQPEPVPANDQPYSAIKVGQTTSTQLNDQLGKAYTEYEEGELEVQTQENPRSPYQPDKFYLQDDVVVMKEQWFEPSLYYYSEAEAIDNFGEPETSLYDLGPNSTTLKALLYPRQGLAVYVVEELGAVRKMQFFEPTSLDKYREKWAPNLGAKEEIKEFKLHPESTPSASPATQ